MEATITPACIISVWEWVSGFKHLYGISIKKYTFKYKYSSMTIANHLAQQLPERQPLMQQLHQLIIKNDPSVVATVGNMMKQEMIIYNCDTFKYGLAGGKAHMSLHVLPMYMDAAIHAKYSKLLPDVKFQRGCINFKNAEEVPLLTISQLIADCATIDIAKILAGRKKK